MRPRLLTCAQNAVKAPTMAAAAAAAVASLDRDRDSPRPIFTRHEHQHDQVSRPKRSSKHVDGERRASFNWSSVKMQNILRLQLFARKTKPK